MKYNYYSFNGIPKRYLQCSVQDTPEKHITRDKLEFSQNYCQINTCKNYTNCSLLQVKGDKQKCINFK